VEYDTNGCCNGRVSIIYDEPDATRGFVMYLVDA